MLRFAKFLAAALLVICFTQAASAQMTYEYGPGGWGGYRAWRLSPEGNIYLSRVYDHLLQTHWGFRHYRMRKECRPIRIPELRADCLASFDQYEPFVGWRGGWY
jgi:hypothetical protein